MSRPWIHRAAARTSLLMTAMAVWAAAGPGAALADCVTPGPFPVSRPAQPLRFGITPDLAGSAGVVQEPAAPVDPARALSALESLRPPQREVVIRLNRMFWSDGNAGLAHFAALVDGYGAAGFRVELQVRYHPPAGHDGDLDGWVAYVRQAVDTFAPRHAVVALSITNEANLPLSPNTSDGVYQNAPGAITRGIVAARQEADRLGRPDLALGFTYAYRSPNDDTFFTQLGAQATPAFRAALDYVGIQAYPGLFYPPASTDPGSDLVSGIALLRTCLLPEAGIGARTAIWVTENGYATRLRQGTEAQAAQLTGTLAAVEAESGTLGVTDYRYFNLRDNNSSGSDLFDAVGLLFDDYTPKTSFGTLRALIAADGTAPRSAGNPPRVPRGRLRVSVRPHRVRRGHSVILSIRVLPARVVSVQLGRWHGRTDRRGRIRLRVRLVGRPGRRTVRATAPGSLPGRAVIHVVA